MNDHVYKLVELTGTSDQSIEQAVDNALKRASRTLRNLRWFEVINVRGDVDADKVRHWQVTVKVGFTLEE